MTSPRSRDRKFGDRDFGDGGGRITWKFTDSSGRRETELTKAQAVELTRSALNTWEQFIDVDFKRVGPMKQADIELRFDDEGLGLFGEARAFVNPLNDEILNSVIHLDPGTDWQADKNFRPGFLSGEENLHATLLEMVGRAIGLRSVDDEDAILARDGRTAIDLNLSDIRAGVAWYGANERGGTRDDDRMVGDDQRDVLKGGNGDDRILGFDGNDRLFGGRGEDRIEGGEDGDDLKGREGKDRMFGGVGNDALDGGEGRDRLEGNAGRDVFVLSKTTDVDILLDFKQGRDRIEVVNGAGGFEDLKITDKQEDARVVLRSGDKFIIQNADASDFTESDFIF